MSGMQVGAITINPDGTYTIPTPGMGPSMFEAYIATLTFPDPNTPPAFFQHTNQTGVPPSYPGTPDDWNALTLNQQWLYIATSSKVKSLEGIANMCITFATGTIAEIQTRAVVTLSGAVTDTVVSAGGLQNLPALVVAGAPTAAPSAPVHLAGTVTSGGGSIQ